MPEREQSSQISDLPEGFRRISPKPPEKVSEEPVIQEPEDDLPEGFRRISPEGAVPPKVRKQREADLINTFSQPEVQEIYKTLSGFSEDLQASPEDEDLIQEFRNFYDRNRQEVDQVIELEQQVWPILERGGETPSRVGPILFDAALKGVGFLAGSWSAFNRLGGDLITLKQLGMDASLTDDERTARMGQLIYDVPSRVVESFNKGFADDPTATPIDRPGGILSETGLVPEVFSVPLGISRAMLDSQIQDSTGPQRLALQGLRAALPFISTDHKTITSNDFLGLAIEMWTPDPLLSLISGIVKTAASRAKYLKLLFSKNKPDVDEVAAEMVRQMSERTSLHPLVERVARGEVNPREAANQLRSSGILSESARQALRLQDDALAKQLSDFQQKTGIHLGFEKSVEPQITDLTGVIGKVGTAPQRTIYGPGGEVISQSQIRLIPLEKRRREIVNALKTADKQDREILKREMRVIERELDEVITDMNRSGDIYHRISPDVTEAPVPERFATTNEAVWYGENKVTPRVAKELYARRAMMERRLKDPNVPITEKRELAQQMSVTREALEAFEETKRVTYLGKKGTSEVSEVAPGMNQVVRETPDGNLTSQVFDETEILKKIDRGQKLSPDELRHVKEDLYLPDETIQRIESQTLGRFPGKHESSWLRLASEGDLRLERGMLLEDQLNLQDLVKRGYLKRTEGDYLKLTRKGEDTFDTVLQLTHRAGIDPKDLRLQNVSQMKTTVEKIRAATVEAGNKPVAEQALSKDVYGVAGVAAGFDLDDEGDFTEEFDMERGIQGAVMGALLVGLGPKSGKLRSFLQKWGRDSRFAQRVMNSVDFSTGIHRGPKLHKLREYTAMTTQQKNIANTVGPNTGWTRREINELRSTGRVPQGVIERTPAHLRPKDRIKQFAKEDGPPSMLAKEVEDQFFVPASGNFADKYSSAYLKHRSVSKAIEEMGDPTLPNELKRAIHDLDVPKPRPIRKRDIKDVGNRRLDTLLAVQDMDGGSYYGVMRQHFYTPHSQSQLAKMDFIGENVEAVQHIKGRIGQNTVEDKLTSIVAEFVSLGDLARGITASGLRKKVGDLSTHLESRKPQVLEQINQIVRQRKEVDKFSQDHIRLWREESILKRHLKDIDDYTKHIQRHGVSDEILNYAINSRKMFNHWLDNINAMRVKLGIDPIHRRDNYVTQLMEESYLHRVLTGVSLGEDTSKFVRPGKKFNPRELARTQDLPFDERIQGMTELLQRYMGVAADELFLNPQIKNARLIARTLEGAGYKKAHKWIDNFVNEAYLGKFTAFDSFVAGDSQVGRWAVDGSRKFKGYLAATVFPLNIPWNLGVQSSSVALIPMRYGYSTMAEAIGRLSKDIAGNKTWLNELKRLYSTQTKIKGGTARHQELSQFADRLARIEKTGLQKVDDTFSWLTNATEAQLSLLANATAWVHFEKMGFTGRVLRELASEGAAKTQSMYTHLERPGWLRSQVWTALNPFQTFSHTMFNTFFHEIWRTEGLRHRSLRAFGSGLAGIAATNLAWTVLFDRAPYSASAWLPFYGTVVEPTYAALFNRTPEDTIDFLVSKTIPGVEYEPPPSWRRLGGTRGLVAPLGVASDVWRGIEDIAFQDEPDYRRFIVATTKYLPGVKGLAGGTGISRVADSFIAMNRNWQQWDRSGTELFSIDSPIDRGVSFLKGPWGTRPGREYLSDRRMIDWQTRWAQRVLQSREDETVDRILEETDPSRYQRLKRIEARRDQAVERLDRRASEIEKRREEALRRIEGRLD